MHNIARQKRSSVNVYRIDRGRSVRVRSTGLVPVFKKFPPRGSVRVKNISAIIFCSLIFSSDFSFNSR